MDCWQDMPLICYCLTCITLSKVAFKCYHNTVQCQTSTYSHSKRPVPFDLTGTAYVAGIVVRICEVLLEPVTALVTDFENEVKRFRKYPDTERSKYLGRI
mmetsp:Transcript_11257/g.24381  ORF Transcript_11257/g.24381 Transcript_11257/m.24381 type:complete len:100 (-) Transcript_11257:730-1029(-)